jgi:hypothetical protein
VEEAGVPDVHVDRVSEISASTDGQDGATGESYTASVHELFSILLLAAV